MPAGSTKRPRASRKLPGEEYLGQRAGSPFYQIEFTIADCRVRESSGTADKAAAAALATKRWDEVWREVKLGEKPRRDITLNDAFARFYTEKGRGTSWGDGGQKYQMAILLRVLGRSTKLADLDDGRVNEMVQMLRQPDVQEDGRKINRSPATINRYLTTLNTVCSWAREMWGVEVGPWKRTKHLMKEAEGREVFLDHEQARRLLGEACAHLRPILLLDLMTGLRRGNVVEMQWEQVSMDLGRAVLVQKGDRRLGIVLPPMAIELLARVEPDPARRKGPVFYFGNPTIACDCPHCMAPSFKGQPIRNVKRSFASAVKRAGLREMPSGRLRFHDLRHTFASWLLAEGGDLRMVQEALGHRDIATTARYSHLLPGRKEAVIGAATAGLSGPPASVEIKKKA